MESWRGFLKEVDEPAEKIQGEPEEEPQDPEQEVEQGIKNAQEFAKGRSDEEIAKEFSNIMTSLPSEEQEKVRNAIKQLASEQQSLEEVFTPIAAKALGRQKRRHDKGDEEKVPYFRAEKKPWKLKAAAAGVTGVGLTALGFATAAGPAAVMLGMLLMQGAGGYTLWNLIFKDT